MGTMGKLGSWGYNWGVLEMSALQWPRGLLTVVASLGLSCCECPGAMDGGQPLFPLPPKPTTQLG